MYNIIKMTNTVATAAFINGSECPTPLVMISSGSYVTGVVEFVVPFQQYLAKQSITYLISIRIKKSLILQNFYLIS